MLDAGAKDPLCRQTRAIHPLGVIAGAKARRPKGFCAEIQAALPQEQGEPWPADERPSYSILLI